MIETTIGALAVAAGTLIYAYFYHVRAARYSDGKSKTMLAGDPLYFWVDLWIKVSTALVMIAAVLVDHPALLLVMRQPAFFWAGLTVAAAGVGFFVWSMLALDRQFSPCNDAYVPDQVVRSGPYRFIRHPIYTANMIMMTGLLLATGSLWIALNLVLLAVFYYRSAVREEASLSEHFPEYAEYIGETGRFLPRLW